MRVGNVLMALAVLLGAGGCATQGGGARPAQKSDNSTQALTDVFTCLSQANRAELLSKYRDSGMSQERAVDAHLKTLNVATEAEREESRPDAVKAAQYAYANASLAPTHVAWRLFTQCRLEKAGIDSADTRRRLAEEGSKCPADDLKGCYQRLFERLQ